MHEISSTAMIFLLGFAAVFMVCGILRPLVLREIVRAAGGKWSFSTPRQNLSEERKAIQQLPQGRLHQQLRIITTIAVLSWFAVLAVGVIGSRIR